MVQVGNYHLGKAESPNPPTVNVLEAGIVWDMLSARYKCIEETNHYLAYAHDPEFKRVISSIGMKMLKSQAEELERQCELFGIPMPPRPPKTVTQKNDGTFTDEFMFRQIFEGCQHFLTNIAYCIGVVVHNDGLRKKFIDFLNDEVLAFHNMCKYGKMKGWLQVPPVFKANSVD
jgi:hypothetical protein